MALSDHPKKYTDFIQESLKYISTYDGMDILEIGVGTVDDCLSTVLNDVYKPKSIVGIDPKFEFTQVGPNFQIQNEDIRDTSFKDNQFDCIVSVAVFEHIRLLDLALEEMYRILKPGGKVFTLFGPIYSSPIGHHLWYTINGRLYKYPELNIAAYAHLLNDEQGFAQHLVDQKIAPANHAKILADFVYNSSDQNRYLFSDYEHFFEKSKFKVNTFKGTAAFPNLERTLHDDRTRIQEKLRQRFPQLPITTFDANCIIVCLEK